MRIKLTLFSSLIAMGVQSLADAPKVESRTWTDPEIAKREDPDFATQGEYSSDKDASVMGAQVVALGNGKFDIYVLDGGLPGAGWEPGKSRMRLHANGVAEPPLHARLTRPSDD